MFGLENIDTNVNHWARESTPENFKRSGASSYTDIASYVENRKCAIGVGFSYNAHTSKFTRHFVFCKKRSCPNCEGFWRRRHLMRMAEREANAKFHGKQYTYYHQVLTTGCKVSKEKVYAAFRYFFQLFRNNVGEVEYFCSVEQNKKATQPHFHFLLAFEGDVSWLDYKLIRKAWQTAQRWAKFPRIATQTFTKKLEGDNIGWYILKYLTKKDEKAYEIPTKEVWDGRHVRHSRHFYPVAVGVIDLAFQSSQVLAKPETSDYYHFELLPSVSEACSSLLDFAKSCVGILEVVKGTWDIHADYCRGRLASDNSDCSRKPFGEFRLGTVQ